MKRFIAVGICALGAATGTAAAQNDLLVSSYYDDAVVRIDGDTGAFLGTFASGGGLTGPQGIAFSRGFLLVVSRQTNSVLRYNATTGAFVDTFISVGLDHPHDMVID
ncbi:MAG: hypothetical protein L0271_05820, partial [Gemmatimonadetes bacterium]|nr:hypothetical protein [Gemmatimonadota bacterium]